MSFYFVFRFSSTLHRKLHQLFCQFKKKLGFLNKFEGEINTNQDVPKLILPKKVTKEMMKNIRFL